jgi:hypothetical protein
MNTPGSPEAIPAGIPEVLQASGTYDDYPRTYSGPVAAEYPDAADDDYDNYDGNYYDDETEESFYRQVFGDMARPGIGIAVAAVGLTALVASGVVAVHAIGGHESPHAIAQADTNALAGSKAFSQTEIDRILQTFKQQYGAMPTDVTVKTRLSVAQWEAKFDCKLQHDLTPDDRAAKRASFAQQACAQLIASAIGKNSYGWNKNQDNELIELWTNESTWSANAKNPGSTAFGIPQSMISLHRPDLIKEFGNNKYSYFDNPVSQIQWGLEYIHGKYGNPLNANMSWHNRLNATGNAWY